MPDKATLASIGFRTVPRWWQEKVAIQLGQSAIPTVGPVMKPEEWLKQRRGSQDSQDSQSDAESESEHESEAGDENELNVDVAPTSGLPHSEAVLRPAEGRDDPAAALELEKIEESEESPNNAVTQTPTIATIETANEPYRKLSDGDLIDLSPISPTVSKSCPLKGTRPLASIKHTDPCPTKTPPPSLPSIVVKQCTTSPRKVFVPAGESTEFHVADARKHAQTQRVELKEDSVETQQCKAANPNTEKYSSTIKSGLMASMHAPPSDRRKSPLSETPSSSNAKNSPRPPNAKGNLLPEPKLTENGRTRKKATVSSNCSRPASRIAGSSDPTVRKAATADGKGASPKPTQNTGKESPKSVCRPRRPAASNNSKAVASRAVTGRTKD
jgi:hypothetical protein